MLVKGSLVYMDVYPQKRIDLLRNFDESPTYLCIKRSQLMKSGWLFSYYLGLKDLFMLSINLLSFEHSP